MTLYATLADYREWSGDESVTVTPRQLASASRFIAAATVGAMYDADSLTGLPTSSTVLDALRDATCELLAHRAEQLEGAELAGLKKATIGSASFELEAATPVVDAAGGMPLDVHLILSEAGLVGGPVIVYG